MLFPGESSSDTATQAGLHGLVESLYGLQSERSRLRGELRLLHSQLEQKERDRYSRIQTFQQQVQTLYKISLPHLKLLCTCKFVKQLEDDVLIQIDELKSCIEEREDELSRLRTATVSTLNT